MAEPSTDVLVNITVSHGLASRWKEWVGRRPTTSPTCARTVEGRIPQLRHALEGLRRLVGRTFIVVLDVFPLGPPNGSIPLKNFLLAFQSKS